MPELVLGFDTETTGLSVTNDQAISYGLCAFRFGVAYWSEQFFVLPDRPISDGARRVHGLSVTELEGKRSSELVLDPAAGVARTIQILSEFANAGAVVVGANVVRFDLEMLRRAALSLLGATSRNPAFDFSRLKIVDVIEHDLAIEPSRDARPHRGLTELCTHYGVTPGRHDALGDARAAVEVFLAQVERNRSGQTSLELMVDQADSTTRPR
ncbi:MAG: 3'-5' exonuclease [Acidobacteriota bacterium]|nr:3'-5' exonuclease [Acidobacteriota bacterium]MDE3043340.1 3'-5' exonuclease [Acidobacteriota bacterium]